MQTREKKLDGEELHQTIIYFLRKSSEERFFNFAFKLSSNSFVILIETLISARYYATQPDASPLAKEFINAKDYLEKAFPDCGSFSKGFFKILTGTDSNLHEQPRHKTTSELQTFIQQKKEFPYVVHISLPTHKYSILVTGSHDKKPQGYIYQTNTAKDMRGEKFSIYHWIKSQKNTTIDVLDHFLKIDILLDQTQNAELRKQIYEMFYTIPISDEVITPKKLDELITISSENSFIAWSIGNVPDNALEKLSILYEESTNELKKLKNFFDILPEDDFVTMFSEKLQNEEITLEEEPNLEAALAQLFQRRKTMEPDNKNLDTATPETKISKPTYMYSYSYFGGIEDSDAKNEEKLSDVKSLEISTTTKRPGDQPSSPRVSR